MSAPPLSSFNIVTAAEDKVGRLEARMALLPPEVMAEVVVAAPVAQPEVAAVAVVAVVAGAEGEGREGCTLAGGAPPLTRAGMRWRT